MYTLRRNNPTFRVDLESNISAYKRKNLTDLPEYHAAMAKHTWTLNLYTMMTLVATLFTLGRAFCYFIFSTIASMKLHKASFENIIGASMKFFDTHLVGNILNRFSRDLAIIDEYVPYIIFDAFRVSL